VEIVGQPWFHSILVKPCLDPEFTFSLLIRTGEAKFGYVGSVGPDHWGSMDPNFTLCAVGTSQSPIDIARDQAVYDTSMQPLHRNYSVANATLVDNVVNVLVRVANARGGFSTENVC
jgi:carbonic anhydrase